MAAASVDFSDHKHQFEPMPNIDEDMKYEVPPLNIDPNTMGDQNRKRRFSVSAEASDDKKISEKFIKKVYPKSKEALSRIEQSIHGVFLFEGLDPEQRDLLIDAMFEKKVVKEDEIISQGDPGDYFYVIECGIYEVWKSPNIKTPQIDSKKVFEYQHRGSFGELALMYNAPRAATVRSMTNGVLWAVDRHTFRHIIVGSTARKRKKYDNFLKDIKLLSTFNDQHRASIADILETQVFNKHDLVVQQGDAAEHFFFIQKGEAIVTLNQDKQKAIRRLCAGDFFGERALLLNDLRSANVQVVTDKLEVAGMDKASFFRLLGPLYDKFKDYFKHYVMSNGSRALDENKNNNNNLNNSDGSSSFSNEHDDDDLLSDID